MQPSDTTVVVYITAPSTAEAERLARALVDERLAACVNRLPVQSIYRWQGQVEEAEEVLLIVKTVRARLDLLASRVRALHSYSVPEIIALPIVAGWPAYLGWVESETRSDG
ncbi:MAG: divalent-cation tolerance protein CutA [Chloroflexi bacterium]|jgi:periplasmic divalent cation tolerance protein|nr:divalent-cation tolerance protein CutA [Chloroflexota bacterium]